MGGGEGGGRGGGGGVNDGHRVEVAQAHAFAERQLAHAQRHVVEVDRNGTKLEVAQVGEPCVHRHCRLDECDPRRVEALVGGSAQTPRELTPPAVACELKRRHLGQGGGNQARERARRCLCCRGPLLIEAAAVGL